MTYTAPAFPVGIKPGGKAPSARALQAALKKCGYLSKLVLPTDKYGPLTEAAVKRFHAANPAYGAANDGGIGPKGWVALFHKAYDTTAPKVPIEPSGNYSRIQWRGHTVNVRTRELLMRAEAAYGHPLYLTQGSYNKGGVAASAGTHDGGGVVDINVSGMSDATMQVVCQRLRAVGFAAWHRTPAQGFAHHIHACAIGDREMAPMARSQVQSYFNGRNGLAGNGPDTNAPRPWPSWASKYNQ